MAKSEAVETKRDVHGCVLAVMKLLGTRGISKDGENASQRFNFRGIDQVLDALNAPLTAAGLVIYPTVKSIDRSERTTKSGGSMVNTVLTIEYRLVSTHDGSEMCCTFSGEASDSGDKGVSKALSMSFKYMAFQLFCIPVEGMDDSDATTAPASIPAKKPSKASSKAQAATEPDEATEVATESDEAPEGAEEPEEALTFDAALKLLKGVSDADELAALKPRLVTTAITKHKDFANKMKPLFLAKSEEFADAA